MIKVLHYGMSSSLGGIEMFIMNLYKNIDRDKIQFDFLTYSDEIYFEDEIKELGGKIYKLTSRRKNIIKNYMETKKFFEENKDYDFIHYHVVTLSYLTPLKIASKETESKLIVHSHSEWKGNNNITKILHNLNKKKINDISDYRWGCSEIAAKSIFGENVIYEENYKLFQNSIDGKKFIYNEKNRKEIRIELGIENKILIGHIGRFSSVKNHEFILEIFSSIYNKNKDARLVLVGDGELKSKIMEKIKIKNLQEVVLLLGVRNDINKLMSAFDILLMPSYYEGLPIVAIEAQAAGLRTILSDVIAKEIQITDLVEFISLDKSAEYWANKILESPYTYERKNKYNEICKSGYDIKENIKWLEKFYIENNKN